MIPPQAFVVLRNNLQQMCHHLMPLEEEGYTTTAQATTVQTTDNLVFRQLLQDACCILGVS